MIYEFPDTSMRIRQGDIFIGLPRIDMSLNNVLIVSEVGERIAQWAEIAAKGDPVNIIVPVRPVAARINQKWFYLPPSDDHAQIKKFMIEQIEGSMNSDIHDHSKPKLLSGKQWSDNELKSITKDIKYYENKYIEETQWQLKANEWIRQLKNSLISSNNTGDNFL